MPTQDWVTRIDRAQFDTLIQAQTLAVSHFYTGLVRLRDAFDAQLLLPDELGSMPGTLTGTLVLPDGTPGSQLLVNLLPFKDARGAPVRVDATALSDRDGHFALTNLPTVPISIQSTLVVQVRGANGAETRSFVTTQFAPLGVLGVIGLKLSLSPMPTSIVASLQDIVGGLDRALPSPERAGTDAHPITITLGDDCAITFRHDLPDERFRYSVLVRLVEPRPSIVTESLLFAGTANQGAYVSALRNAAWADVPGTARIFTERVPVDQPISVDGFRDRLVGNIGGFISDAETVPMAGTLGLGYLVHLGQQWTSSGLSLGDLIYSLPLAPGEQQRIAVFEQRQTLSTAEFEALDFSEQQRASQISDASTQAVFTSAFNEHLQGASSFTTKADSSSWGVAGGVGLALGPVVLGVGAGGGGGSSSSSGSSSNSLDGSRDYVSTASSQAHNSVEREASARRRAQRTSMRLATATDVEQVTTKVITNNNRAHALTMQYWEVLRHFDIATEVDGVTLVCFVPLEVVRFMPPGVSSVLAETDVQTRAEILYRYGQLLRHADILRLWLPPQYRQGLTILEEFAANPRAVPNFTSPTEEIIHIELTGSFLPFEDIYVQVLTRRQTLLGPLRMSGPVAPLPDTVTDPSHAYTSQVQMMADVKRRRASVDTKLSADVVLPSSLNPDDVVGFQLTRNFRSLQYQLAPASNDPVQQLIAGGNVAGILPLLPILQVRLETEFNGVFMSPETLEQELGGPSIWGFSARTADATPETYASNFISQDSRFPMPTDGYPVAAMPVNPLLKFDELLKIEQMLQHVTRNTVTYSRAVWMSVTPEERAIMLEGYTIGVPSGGVTDATQHVPLLNCVANQVMGFYGNAMIMPFNIPAEVSARVGVDGAAETRRAFTTAEVQNALTRFHRAGFASPVSHITLPTHGVLGEAVLGSCPSAEKIDLTRFWNWGDSPLPQAADIAGNLLNKGSTLIGATAPNTLTGLPSIITNVNSPAADSVDALKALIAGQNTKDFSTDITGAQQLAVLQGKTLDTAEKARADALARAQTLATEGLNKAGDIMKARADAQKATTDANKATADATKKAADAAQKERATQVQSGVADMRSNAGSYLGVADNKSSQDAADAYAVSIVQQKFGATPLPIDIASTLFSVYHKFASGNTGPLTRGSAAFLKTLGLL
ncbi:MAG: hypothetical protein NVSMB2_16070 [Chloroflexota bacterium]